MRVPQCRGGKDRPGNSEGDIRAILMPQKYHSDTSKQGAARANCWARSLERMSLQERTDGLASSPSMGPGSRQSVADSEAGLDCGFSGG